MSNSRHVGGKKDPSEWQDAFLTLEERFRHLQRELKEKDEELKFAKVSQRRSTVTANTSGFTKTSATSQNMSSRTLRPTDAAAVFSPSHNNNSNSGWGRGGMRGMGGASARRSSALPSPSNSLQTRHPNTTSAKHAGNISERPSPATHAWQAHTTQDVKGQTDGENVNTGAAGAFNVASSPSLQGGEGGGVPPTTGNTPTGLSIPIPPVPSTSPSMPFQSQHPSLIGVPTLPTTTTTPTATPSLAPPANRTPPLAHSPTPSPFPQTAFPSRSQPPPLMSPTQYFQAGPPDPSMVWGSDFNAQHYLVAKELYDTNEQLRSRLQEAQQQSKEQQHELARMREAVRTVQQQDDEVSRQLHQLVRERDVAAQKLENQLSYTRKVEESLRLHEGEHEKVRFGLETQIAELRSRLVIGADNNEHLSKDVRKLLMDVKERTLEAQSLRSKLTLAEASLSAQKQNNESLLVELRSLNGQLAEERKRMLSSVRDAHVTAMRLEHLTDVEGQLRAAVEAKTALEKEHVNLMGDFARTTEEAMRMARSDMQQEVSEWKKSAQHWERVAQLVFKDIEQRTAAHMQCREEREVAKRDCDAASMRLRETRELLEFSDAKLEVVWPTHRNDTRGLGVDDILSAFHDRQHAVFGSGGGGGGGGRVGDEGETMMGSARRFLVELKTDVPLEAHVRELQEANGALVAHMEQLQLTNNLLTERVKTMTTRMEEMKSGVSRKETELNRREQAGYRLVEQQVDRIQFLESQVHSLRGHKVSPNTSLLDIGANENVLELFVGQLLSTTTPQGINVRNTFPLVFCSVDFLVHETVTTPIVTGLNAMVDTTLSFCISMDALLVHYMRTRELTAQLHRVRSADEMTIANASNKNGEQHHIGDGRAYETIAEGSINVWELLSGVEQRDSKRPTLRGHIPLYDIKTHEHIASLEFSLMARVPFTDSLLELVDGAGGNNRSFFDASSIQKPNVSSRQITDDDDDNGEDGDGGGGEMSRVSTASGGGGRIGGDTLTSPLRNALPNNSTVSTTSPSRATRGTVVRFAEDAMRSAGGGGDSPSLKSSAPVQTHPGGSSDTSSSSQLYRERLSVDTTARSLSIDVQSVKLPRSLIPVPRLSCYYSLESIGRNVYLAANPIPRHSFSYLQENGPDGTLMEIRTPQQAKALARESLVLVFFDETKTKVSPSSAQQYWAIAVCTLDRVMHSANQTATRFDLPLTNSRGEQIDDGGAFVTVVIQARRAPYKHIKSGGDGALESHAFTHHGGGGGFDAATKEEERKIEEEKRTATVRQIRDQKQKQEEQQQQQHQQQHQRYPNLHDIKEEREREEVKKRDEGRETQVIPPSSTIPTANTNTTTTSRSPIPTQNVGDDDNDEVVVEVGRPTRSLDEQLLDLELLQRNFRGTL